MLIFAEGTVNEPLSDVERAAVRAWLGPMVDEGFIQSGYINMARDRVWIMVSTRYIDRGHRLLATRYGGAAAGGGTWSVASSSAGVMTQFSCCRRVLPPAVQQLDLGAHRGFDQFSVGVGLGGGDGRRRVKPGS
jgi:hypothetical protein